MTGSCTYVVTVAITPIDGVCGSADGNLFYGQNSLNAGSATLCSVGVLTGFTGPDVDGDYSWSCE